jgi:hypothetical protein
MKMDTVFVSESSLLVPAVLSDFFDGNRDSADSSLQMFNLARQIDTRAIVIRKRRLAEGAGTLQERRYSRSNHQQCRKPAMSAVDPSGVTLAV